VIGELFEKRIEGLGNWVIAGSLVGLGLILLAAELFAKHERAVADISVPDALLVGFAQAGALVPGSSRSGMTITAGLLLGLRREDAARFSFHLAVPITLGAGAYKLRKVIPALAGDPAWRNATIVGTLVAGVVGYVVIGWFLAWLRERTTIVFVVWRILAAAAIALLIWRGAMPSGAHERPAAPPPSLEAR
jgi:undecaprenyl-diphosphatase